MRSSGKNFTVTVLAALLLGVVIFAAAGTFNNKAIYHLAINCGDMGQYQVVPNSLQVAPDRSGMYIGETLDGGLVKFPPYCVVNLMNKPNYTGASKVTTPEKGEVAA